MVWCFDPSTVFRKVLFNLWGRLYYDLKTFQAINYSLHLYHMIFLVESILLILIYRVNISASFIDLFSIHNLYKPGFSLVYSFSMLVIQ